MMNNRQIAILAALIALTLIGATLQLTVGAAGLSLGEVAEGLLDPSSFAGSIVWRLRMPRAVFAMVVGAGLSVCGLALQGLFRNPLAEPFTLGISSGAGFGAVLAMALGAANGLIVSAAAFTGALAVTLFVFMLVQRSLFSQTALILCGVMIGYFFQSALLLLIAMTSSERALGAMMWLLGDLSAAPSDLLAGAAVVVALGTAALMWRSTSLDLLSLGEDKAASLGVDVQFLRRWVFVWTSLIAGACVSAVGVVGFVGLIIPHALRNVAGPRHSVLFVLCLFGGAAFLLFCDLAAKTAASPVELPLGVVTGMIGSVAFLWIFLRKGA